MFNISESQKKVLTAWGVAAIIIFLIVVLVAITIKNKEDKDEKNNITATNSNYLIDRNRYYTIKTAISKYYSYLNVHDYDAVLKILNEKYVEDNNIDKNNLKEFINITDTALAYNPHIMCLKSVNKGVYTFVTNGDELGANTGKILDQMYYQIIMDGNTSLFSLEPISESTYEEVCNGEG